MLNRAEKICSWLRINGSRILAIENVEHLVENIYLHAFADVEARRKTQIQIDEWRRRELVSFKVPNVSTIRIPVAVWIDQGRLSRTGPLPAVMETALCSENAAYLKLPGKRDHPLIWKI